MDLIPTMRGPIALATIRTSAALGLRVLVQAGTLLLVARSLGPEKFGAFAGVAALAVMLGTLSTFGLHLVLFGEVSKSPASREKILTYALPTTLVSGFALLLAFLVICTLALRNSGANLTVLIAIGASELLLQPLMALIASEQSALGKPAQSQLLQLLPLALRLITAIIVIYLEPMEPLAAYSYGYFMATAIAFFAALKFVPKAWPGMSTWRWPQKGELRDSSGYAALNITAIGPTELDKTLSASLLPLAAAGLYASAARIVGAIILPVTALILSSLPRLYRDANDHPERTARLIHWIFGASFIYGSILAILLWWLAPVFNSFFGVEYRGMDEIIRWMCLAVPAMSLRLTAASALMALGKPWTRVGLELTGLVILMGSAIWLTDQLGASGMPLALASAEWVMAIAGATLAYRATRLSAPQ